MTWHSSVPWLLMSGLIAAACGQPSTPGSETVPASALDQKSSAHDGGPKTPAPTEASGPTLGDVAIPDIRSVPPDQVGLPPTSKPAGQPVEFEVEPPPVGTTRIRSTRDEQAYGITAEKTRQTTTRVVQLFETITGVEGKRITELRAEVRRAQETVRFADSAPNRMQLLQGTYVVRPGDDEHRLEVEHATGRDVGSREVEELGYVLIGEFDEPWFIGLLSSLALRPGESRRLTDAEVKTITHGDPMPAPMFASVVFADDAQVTYQLDSRATDVGMFEVIAVRQTITVRRSDGQILGLESITIRRERGGDTSQLASRAVVTYP